MLKVEDSLLLFLQQHASVLASFAEERQKDTLIFFLSYGRAAPKWIRKITFVNKNEDPAEIACGVRPAVTPVQQILAIQTMTVDLILKTRSKQWRVCIHQILNASAIMLRETSSRLLPTTQVQLL